MVPFDPYKNYEHYVDCPCHEDSSGYVCDNCGAELVKEATYCPECWFGSEFVGTGGIGEKPITRLVLPRDCVCEDIEESYGYDEADRRWASKKDMDMDMEDEGWI